MGMYRSEYLGPYIECQTTKVAAQKQIRACVTDGCSHKNKYVYDSSTKFCPNCGGPIQNTLIDVEMTAVADPRQLCEDEGFAIGAFMGEAWDVDETTHIFVPERPGPRVLSVDVDATGILADIEATDIIQERAWIETSFARELGVLREKYGTDNVSVRWGLLVTYS